MKRLIAQIKIWWKRRHCRHLIQYKGSRSDGIRKYLDYECPYCGKRFVSRL